MINLTLHTPVSEISRVGKTVGTALKKLEIETASDLIFYYPWRWEDLSNVVEIAELEPDQLSTVQVTIQTLSKRSLYSRKRFLIEAVVSDDSDELKVVWFNQTFITKVLKEGDKIYLSGKMSLDKNGVKQMVSPVYEKAKSDTTHTARVVPVYPLTSRVTQKQLRFLIKEVINLSDEVKDFLPVEVIKENDLLDLSNALKQIHFPENSDLLEKAINRLKFDELFLFQLQVMLSREEINQSTSPVIEFYEEETKQLLSSLSFELTDDQKKSIWQILSDMKKNRPMNRLLEGDVGSGKTIVSALVMLNVLLNDNQSVLMSPTEILAVQHYQSVTEILKEHKSKIGLLTRTQRVINGQQKTKKEMLQAITSGEVKIVIGTHALIQDEVNFNNLSLAVIDEQHRFGVNQRKLLRHNSGDEKTTPHLLSMTATPIPRSLALALYGDLDVSIIKQMPLDRKKIITKIVENKKRQIAYDFIKKEVASGRQIFVVCPLVDPSDKLGVKSVTEEYKRLQKEIFPDLKVSMIHGKLKSSEKEEIMNDFAENKSNILVSTSVIEVGVNVPNATVMMIEDADRFGLAQLHQFRGRVGRSGFQSYCLLFSESKSPKTFQRLKALESAKDGFELAEIDLEQRGPGNIYGQNQSGWPEFKIAKLSDSEIISQSKISAEKIISQSFDLKDFPLLKEKMTDFLSAIHLE